jgi:hypothetical protein
MRAWIIIHLIYKIAWQQLEYQLQANIEKVTNIR